MLSIMRAYRREVPSEAELGEDAICIHLRLYLRHQKKILCFLAAKPKNKAVYSLPSSHKTTTVDDGKQKSLYFRSQCYQRRSKHS